MSDSDQGARIRLATIDDVPDIVRLVRELAEYERELDQAHATEADFSAALFGPDPAAFCHVVETGGRVVGLALWFLNFSTWTGRHGIYLEELIVTASARGRGYGLALMRELAAICVERGYARFEWSVLDWNEPSLAFYRSLGAIAMDEWTVQRLSGDALTALGT